MTGLLDYIQIAIGIYMGFYAIRGKGKIYENEFVKEGMEEKYRKTIRLWLAIISPLIIIVGTLGILGYNDGTLTSPAMILWILTMVCFVLLLVQTSRLTDRTKAKAASAAPAKPRRNPAFDFDDEEAGEDDTAARLENKSADDGE